MRRGRPGGREGGRNGGKEYNVEKGKGMGWHWEGEGMLYGLKGRGVL